MTALTIERLAAAAGPVLDALEQASPAWLAPAGGVPPALPLGARVRQVFDDARGGWTHGRLLPATSGDAVLDLAVEAANAVVMAHGAAVDQRAADDREDFEASVAHGEWVDAYLRGAVAHIVAALEAAGVRDGRKLLDGLLGATP